MKYSRIRALLGVIMLALSFNLQAQEQDKFELVHFNTEDGGNIEAAYFKTESNKIVIFAHGAIFNKESWYFLCEEFQRNGVSALSIDFRGYGNSKAGSSNKKLYDIIGAIDYAKEQGFSEISVVGASMGGAAVLAAFSFKEVPVNKVVLLAPAGGAPIESDKMQKLFVVSKEEGLYQTVTQIFADTREPKTIKEYEGDTHAQHLFNSSIASELNQLILNFIVAGR